MKPQQQKILIARLVAEGMMQERIKTVKAVYASFIICLKDQWDWCNDDINKLMAQTDEQFLLMKDKFVSPDDFGNWLEEEGFINDKKP